MGIPHRGTTTESTYFVTANVLQKRSLFQVEKIARKAMLTFPRIPFSSWTGSAAKAYLFCSFTAGLEGLLHPGKPMLLRANEMA